MRSRFCSSNAVDSTKTFWILFETTIMQSSTWRWILLAFNVVGVSVSQTATTPTRLSALEEHPRYKFREMLDDSSWPFISLDLWTELADVVCGRSGIECNLSAAHDTCEDDGKDNPVRIFVETSMLKSVVSDLNEMKRDFVLITADNDDECSPRPEHRDAMNLLRNSPNLKEWWTKQPCVEHEKLFMLPIGTKWQWKSRDFYGESKRHTRDALMRRAWSSPSSELILPLRLLESEEDVSKRSLIYVNFSPRTTDRATFEPHRFLRRDPALSDAMSRLGVANRQETGSPRLSFEDYLDEMSTHRFAFAPPGRAQGTHRVWEALLVGTVPIVYVGKGSPHAVRRSYDELPVVLIDDWSELTRTFLESQWSLIRTRAQRGEYDFNRMLSIHWARRIFRRGQ